MDRDSELWVDQLRKGHPHRAQAVAKLHDVLLRIAYHELSRRRGQLGSIKGPEFEDLAQQAADDALMSILGRLDDFLGLSRFTTWAYKFVIFEVSGKVARHAWRRAPPSAKTFTWEGLPDSLAPRPDDRLEHREQLEALTEAVGELADRQREVFVAVALHDVSIDVLAANLGSNRNAIYKNLFDARRNLRARMAASRREDPARARRTFGPAYRSLPVPGGLNMNPAPADQIVGIAHPRQGVSIDD